MSTKNKDSFTNMMPRIATKEDCNANWGGGKPGEYFRCGFCGHKFKPGDYWRWQFTNDIPTAPGNPLVCQKCDGTSHEVRKKWAEKWEAYMSDEWWWFRKHKSEL